MARLKAIIAAAAVFLALPNIALAGRYSAILIDVTNGEVLLAQDADNPRFPASLTKMMTLYMAFDALKAGQLKLDQQLAVSSEVAAQRPSSIGLRKGERISVQDAIAAVVTKSANDAAVALAEAMAGSEAKFAKAMTDRARQLGMEGTDFAPKDHGPRHGGAGDGAVAASCRPLPLFRAAGIHLETAQLRQPQPVA
jgi:D-alanyl-D-alanine carboxypeptidase